ncbi:MG2 domain-containing protein [Pseudoduganella danionis]|uniref:alpha-2-macroglobulin family protein n=1 Tax=Pseudoduganella danionis TaxID=1890295 RepID=UPI0035ADBB7A
MRLLSRLAAIAALCSLPLAVLAESSITRFSPVGTVKQVRQVKVRFSAQMVPLGDLRLEDPFSIDCGVPGKGRWVDGRNWVYDFERDLPAAESCRFTLKDSVRDLAGQPMAGEHSYSFNTDGPKILMSSPRQGAYDIDEQQVFILGLDAPATSESISEHAWCRAQGINERIGVRLLTGAERQRVLDQRKDMVERHLVAYYRARGVVWSARLAVRDKRLEQLSLAVLQCKQRLPAKAEVTLVWGAGIAAENGMSSAQDQHWSFSTRPDFTASFSCDKLKKNGGCIPFLPMRLGFSAPVRKADMLAISLRGPGGKTYRGTLPKEQQQAEFVDTLEFKGPFPERAAFTLNLPAGLKDDGGRSLLNAERFPLAVRTDAQPPLIKFPARFGIIEARGDRMLPVTLRNVEASLAVAAAKIEGSSLRVNDAALAQEQQDRQIMDWLHRLTGYGGEPRELAGDALYQPLLAQKKGAAASGIERFAVPKPAGRQAMEVVGIPLRKPGFYVVELASPRLGAGLAEKPAPAYVSAAALVTNMVAHFKHGASSSLVWVTSLDQGKPVAQAQVSIRDCDGKLLRQGVTNQQGVASFSGELPERQCMGSSAYFITARSGNDMTFTASDWTRGIESWRFNVPSGDRRDENVLATTVFDRTLLRAGETVHMKHFLRRHTEQGFSLLTADSASNRGRGAYGRQLTPDERKAQPENVQLLHEGSEQRYQVALKWSANGSAESEWHIPADAKQGWYQLLLGGRDAGRFRVEQFRVPTMKAVMQGPKTPAVQASSVDLDVQLSYLSGGAAAGVPVQLRTVLQNKSLYFEDYADFTFNAGDVRTGMEREQPVFDDDEGSFEGEQGDASAASGFKTRKLTLDKQGGARVTLDQLPAVTTPQELLTEMSYQDANGETLSATTTIPLWNSAYLIGLQPDGWVASKDGLKFTVVVLDVQGKPVAQAPVTVDFFQRLQYSHRRRLIGGFYAYENQSEVKALGPACAGQTDSRGLLICEVKAPASGNLILRASTHDSAQRAAITQRETWVADGADWWFSASDNDRIDLLPEQKRYEPGQTASFQLRMPFREATALITVEREGVLDTYVRQVTAKEPVFTLPVKGNYAPNVYVSALVVRGRAAGVQPTALVDLGKPAYKLGITPLRVGWAAHELKVQVKTDKPVYNIREKASVQVKVARADGAPLPAGAEVALAAVDVGLLELMPNTSWELLEAMMQQRNLQVQTATAQMQVVGKRHFGRKAVPHGGGGGKGAGRELFDTLLFWKARVVLDANGEASVQVPINDSLTAFRIVAIASADADLFGTGRTEIRSSQDLMLLSGLPPVVREGDRLRAGFTLRNTSDAAVQVALTASAGGKALAPQQVALEAGAAQEIGWDYLVPAGASTLAWDIAASIVGSDGAAARDRLKVSQRVLPAVPVRTTQATLLQLDQGQRMQVRIPDDALPGRGGVQVQFSARLGSELAALREYMSQYPYRCFEQVTSRAIALHDKAMWQANMETLPAHLDGDGLVKYFAPMAQGDEMLTAYVLSAAHEGGYAIPEDLRNSMLTGLRNFVAGRIVRWSALRTTDLAVRKLAALEAISHYAPIQVEQLQSFAIEPNLWPTSAVIDWYQILKHSPQLPQRAQRWAQAEQILQARLNLQGTTMGFSTERSDNWWWLMASGDSNANRLLLAVADNPGWKEDIGRLARGALGRQRKGRWNTTVANAWGTLALERFSQLHERVAVTGSSSATLAQVSKSIAYGGDATGGKVMLPWPRGSAELELNHKGTGKPWVTVQTLAALPLKAPLSSGYRISKSITALEQKQAGVWSRGDVYRVRLELEAQADMTWVVVDDPIPASATVLGTGLGTDSQILGASKQQGWVWPVFEERSFDGYHAFYQFVPKGKWSVEYTVRLNNAGQFNLPSTRVEAMYNPEMFGELPNAVVTVK